MIRVTVDLWPGGDQTRATRLASIDIINTGDGTPKRSTYITRFYDKNNHRLKGRDVVIANWARLTKPVLSLVRQALEFARY